MATLPRAHKSPPTTSVSVFRPHSVSAHEFEFDAGINASNAWMSGDAQSLLQSDDENDGDDDGEDDNGRWARALYDFEGKPEFRELSVEAGDEIDVVKEEVGDGWSLIKTLDGKVGLLPRSYYTFTSEFFSSPDLKVPGRSKRREPSDTTPRASPKQKSAALPLVPQSTGEWFPSFRHSLLKGKSLNRFSTFVTSGAEEWVLKGSPVPDLPPAASHNHERTVTIDADEEEEASRQSMLQMSGEADRHFVEAGPSWKSKLPPFKVLVHSPSKRTSTLSGSFTIYSVTSLFHSTSTENDENDDTDHEEDNHEYRPPSPTRITVYRRFSHFVFLHTALSRRLPGIALPPLPEKQYAGRFSNDFVEARRGDLERYLGKIVRHPVARYAEVVTFFLGCDNDMEWKKMVPQHLSLPPAGPAFYSHVFHPAFNVDAEDAEEAVNRFDAHTKATGKSVQSLRTIFGRAREARLEMSKAERLLSYSLLSLILSKPLEGAPTTGATEDEEDEKVHTGNRKGLMNEDGAWCWRENCSDCLHLTKSMQKTSDALQSVADLYDDHARRTQLATHESLKSVAHPSSLYEGVVTTHRSALTRYHESTRFGQTDEDVAARCETVLNTTMAEMDIYHAQKVEDFSTIAKEHLDGEIALYEQVLQRLYNARRAFDEPPTTCPYPSSSSSPSTPSSPSSSRFTITNGASRAGGKRQPSMYERDLDNRSFIRKLAPEPLKQPTPHVYDSAPMRPVSVAIQEGVGMLTGSGRGNSVFKFW